ncbi:transferrin-binding protein-like solute binding protein [Ahrensia kielensis]|uniref:Transferrin-binding protein-like solute binding protein n=1 Tax=Ahrensia kielensis TaxID=76980 RepID=A0ABU9T2I3_9HYPH
MNRFLEEVKIPALSAVTALILSGCTSSNAIDTAVYANAPADTFGAKFSEDTKFVAEKGRSAGLALNYGKGTVAKTGEQDFSLKKNDRGGIDVTIEGRDFSFGEKDKLEPDDEGNVYDFEQDADGKYAGVFSYTGTLEQALGEGREGQRYHRAIGYQIYDGSEPNLRGVAVIGAETPQAAMDALASSAKPIAKYSGTFRVDSFPTAEFASVSSSRTRVRGDFDMEADFGAGTISGETTYVEAREPGQNDFSKNDNHFEFSKTDITGNGYEGTVTANGGDAVGKYSGGFYGPSAEEIAGVISTEVTYDDDGTYVGIGAFSGAQEAK